MSRTEQMQRQLDSSAETCVSALYVVGTHYDVGYAVVSKCYLVKQLYTIMYMYVSGLLHVVCVHQANMKTLHCEGWYVGLGGHNWMLLAHRP